MTKKVLFAAMGAALAVAGNAQAPILNHVTYVVSPSTGNPDNVAQPWLLSQRISSVAVSGDSMFFSGEGGTEASFIKVSNWWKPSRSLTRVIKDDTQARPSKVIIDGNFVWFWSSLGGTGSATTSMEGRKYDFAGNLQTSVGGNLVDGILYGSEVSGDNYQDVTIDPVRNTLAFLRLNSWGIIFANTSDGSAASPLSTNFPTAPVPVSADFLRGFAFDASGNPYYRHVNDVWTGTRTPANDGPINGLSSPLQVANLVNGSRQRQNIMAVSGGPGYSPFVMFNDDLAGSGSAGSVTITDATGSTVFSTLTGSPAGNFTHYHINFGQAQLNGTQYLFISNFKGGTQGVDVYQVGNAGRIDLSASLLNYVGTPSTASSRSIAVQVLDATTNELLDAKTIVTPDAAPATGSISFYTVARGNVKVRAKTNGSLWNSISGSAGNTPISGSIAITMGDVDNSGEIDAADIDLVIADFGNVPPIANAAPTDVDGSGEVDAADIDLVIASFGGVDN